MVRLNQSRRQKIGFIYCPQVDNDILAQPKQRQMAEVQEQVYNQNMRGKQNMDPIIRIEPTPPPEDTKGSGISPAGGSRGSIQPSVGQGVSPSDPHIVKLSAGAPKPGADQALPGDMLKKKLLQKMVREKRMKALGDRVKTTPIVAGMDGGSLVIPGSRKAGGQSASKTLPGTKSYKLNPKPLVGAGKHKGGFIFAAIAAIAASIAAAASAAAATTVVGTVTVGALAGAALTGAAGAAGAAIVGKIAGDGVHKELKTEIVKIAKANKIGFKDMSKAEREKIKSGLVKLKANPGKAGVIEFAKMVAPIALKATQKTLKPKIAEEFKKSGLTGSGLSLAGSGLSLAGGAKTFKNAFVKNLIKQLT